MTNDQKKGYPVMPVGAWWSLRERFRRTIPATVTASYLASALNITEVSAQNNILPTLRTVALIDESGKPTEKAVKWRDDVHYKQVCHDIRNIVYPKELLDLAPAEAADRAEVQRWFTNTARVGESAAKKMAAFYMLLCEADPSKVSAPTARAGSPKAKEPSSGRKEQQTPGREKAGTTVSQRTTDTTLGEKTKHLPAIHLNIQVHISPEATPDQIDQIFSSIAKHLK